MGWVVAPLRNVFDVRMEQGFRGREVGTPQHKHDGAIEVVPWIGNAQTPDMGEHPVQVICIPAVRKEISRLHVGFDVVWMSIQNGRILDFSLFPFLFGGEKRRTGKPSLDWVEFRDAFFTFRARKKL